MHNICSKILLISHFVIFVDYIHIIQRLNVVHHLLIAVVCL
jgi:hypothetical protein